MLFNSAAWFFSDTLFRPNHPSGSLLVKKGKAVIVQPNRVTVGNAPSFGWVFMADFLRALTKRLKKNTMALENYCRIFVPPGMPLKCEKNEPLRINIRFKHIQDMQGGDVAVIAETGDSWFNCLRVAGWSVGATHGYVQAAPDKRVIACIDDGSFQVTAQDVSTMIRCVQRSIIFLINNGNFFKRRFFQDVHS